MGECGTALMDRFPYTDPEGSVTGAGVGKRHNKTQKNKE